jgi:hypothetical protein
LQVARESNSIGVADIRRERVEARMIEDTFILNEFSVSRGFLMEKTAM